MAILSKVFIGLACLGALLCGVFGYQLHQKLGQRESQLASVETAFKNSTVPSLSGYSGSFKDDPNAPASQISTANAAFSEITADLEKRTAEAATLKTQMEAETAKVADLTEQKTRLESLARAAEDGAKVFEQQVEELKAENAKMTADIRSTGYPTAADVKAELDKRVAELESAQTALQAVTQERELIARRVGELEQVVTLWKSRSAPLDLSARVVEINKAWNFVVLDAGNKAKLSPGVDLTVYRGDQFVGKIRTVSVDDELSIADVLPEWKQADIQVGDQVLF